MTRTTLQGVIRFTHRALGLNAVAGLAGLIASLSGDEVIAQLGTVAVCAAVPGTLTLSAIASRLATLAKPRRVQAATVATLRQAA